MSAQTNVVLRDAAVANHTFVALGVGQDGVARWVEKTTSALPAGFFNLTSSLRLPTKNGDPVRGELKLTVPTMVTETINGVTYQKAVRQALVTISVIAAGDSTAAERESLLAYARDMLSGSQAGAQGLIEQFKNLDPLV